MQTLHSRTTPLRTQFIAWERSGFRIHIPAVDQLRGSEILQPLTGQGSEFVGGFHQ